MNSTSSSEEGDSYDEASAGEGKRFNKRKGLAENVNDATIDCEQDEIDGNVAIDGSVPKAVYRGKLKSQYKGVFKCGTKFKAQIQTNRVQHYLGLYNTAIEAAKAYDNHARVVLGPKAKTNFVYDPNEDKPVPTQATNASHDTTLSLQQDLAQKQAQAKQPRAYQRKTRIQPIIELIPAEEDDGGEAKVSRIGELGKKRAYVGIKRQRKAMNGMNIYSYDHLYQAAGLSPVAQLQLQQMQMPHQDKEQHAQSYFPGTLHMVTAAAAAADNAALTGGMASLMNLAPMNPPAAYRTETDEAYKNPAASMGEQLQLYQQYQFQYQQYLQHQIQAAGGSYYEALSLSTAAAAQQMPQYGQFTFMPPEQGQDYPLQQQQYLAAVTAGATGAARAPQAEQPSEAPSVTAEAKSRTLNRVAEKLLAHGGRAVEHLHIDGMSAYAREIDAARDATADVEEEEEEEDELDWRDQLYYWTGTLTPEEGKLLWKGSWVGSYSGPPSATDFVSSSNHFEYSSEVPTSSIPFSGLYNGFYLMDNYGSGALDRYVDKELHLEFIARKDEVWDVVGRGDSEFGPFVVRGSYDKETGVLEVARQYTAETDPRSAMSIAELSVLFWPEVI
ncbi:hypothetical protein B484DRAFT_433657 [Ochromonadaceae sp. CCMP2298]|nr:hypothetical protein B484DRAFT_433657 [Ochromonadaceae sp. CCMP2298]|mmetsp:Transcript_13708/g.30224  ORF Transcript_13708/g.30224 Transcript_13708/m.30224 type:complete len:613 (-) Transcript_13708:575-2413(-)|eukprot:CAMPEP_0173178078 /NCGR_PEP_ID=MMETSP1141-20130122/5332_1 /TAXON_ID=483371 /ORGANISM="non described non described, Strain CCMP2298" /LENGTH=612 /DNA_ID=CAMNT_0014100521 /DNA_START=127 /DNA_END=1965 /DNA_ORIENTATION=+